MDENPYKAPQASSGQRSKRSDYSTPPVGRWGLFSGMKRILWHLYGVAAALIFAASSASFVDGNLALQLPQLVWLVIAAASFVALLPYFRWGQINRTARPERRRSD
jgi:hypothetical protein